MKLTQSSPTAKRRTTRAAERLTLDLMTRLELAKVASRLRAARIEASLTQEQMADLLGVHKRVVENVENNRLVKGPYQYVNAWSEATGWSVRRLLHGDDELTPQGDQLVSLLAESAENTRRLEDLEAALSRIEALLRSASAGQ